MNDAVPGPDQEKADPVEQQVLTAAMSGGLTDLRTAGTDNDPAHGSSWDASRQVRASLLAELLTGTRRTDGNLPRSIKLRGARIIGSLNLEAATLTCPLLLQDCYIDELVSFDEVTATAIRLPGCHLRGLTARQLRTIGDLDLSAVMFTITGETRLDGAHIGGSLDLNRAIFTNPCGTALNADDLTVERSMLCEGFTATGEVRLVDAHIGGQLDLLGATLTNTGRIALSANRLTVGGDMSSDGLKADGEILLVGAHIGQLSLNVANLNNPGPGKIALNADNLTVDRHIFCNGLRNRPFTATGEIRLLGANIGGQLSMRCANLAHPRETALTADLMTVGQGMQCMDDFRSDGEVRLVGAHISGQLLINNAHLNNPDMVALNAAQVTVDGDMSCGMGFTAAGRIVLEGAHIGKRLFFSDATLTDPGRLYAASLTVGGDMFCTPGFTAADTVSLPGASIGGELNLLGASLADDSELALDIGAASIQTLRMPVERPEGIVDFTNATVGVLIDDEKSWPDVLWLRGFTYERLGNAEVKPRARLRWVKRHPGRFTPQLYDQLAKVYQSAGDDPAARTVAVAKQWRRRRPFDPLNWLWYATVGYGYRTWLAGIWLAALMGLGTWIFSKAYPAHMIAISDHPSAFHAAAYAFDILVPVIGLGQKTAWQPEGSAYLYWSWALTIAGWVLTTAVVAGLSGILKRD